jgi:cyclophilin family peptidyl-prolyl cis-trans isomerase
VQRYAKLGAGVAVAFAGLFLAFQYVQHQEREAHGDSWGALMAGVNLSALLTGGGTDELRLVATEHAGKPAGVWAAALLVTAEARQGKLDQAGAALEEFRSLASSHPLLRNEMPWGSESVRLTLPEFDERLLQQAQAWREEHAQLFSNPAPAPDAPRVQMRTSMGSVTLQLYPERAPRHVENFLTRVRVGSYAGTRIHMVVPGALVYAGDPYSVQDDLESVKLWGKGGAGETVAKEDSGLSHFAGVLASVPLGGADGGSQALQFCLTVSANHALDESGTVFGQVIDGLSVLRAISETETVESSQRPRTSIVIEDISVL